MATAYTWAGVGSGLTVASLGVLLTYHAILGHLPKCHQDTSVPHRKAGSALLNQPNPPCPGRSSSKGPPSGSNAAETVTSTDTTARLCLQQVPLQRSNLHPTQ